jgi:hypothetical protein
MATLSLRPQRAVSSISRPSRAQRGATTKGGASGAQGNALGTGQSVRVKIAYLPLVHNHTIDLDTPNGTTPIGVWRGTEGIIESVQCDKIRIKLKTSLSTSWPKYSIKAYAFWDMFELA